MKTEILDQPERRVAALRHVGAYHRIGETFGRLGGIAGPAGLFGPDTTMLAIYHDDPETTPEAELRSDAGLTIAEGRSLPDGLAEHRIPAGRYACATHVGAYEGLADAWSQFMGRWLPQSGHRVREGVCFEIYRNDPTRTPKEELITEMYVPLV